MGKPSAITWLLLLLVLLPIGVLTWLGFHAADAFDAADASRLRNELAEARRQLGSLARLESEELEASIQALLEAQAGRLAAAGPDFARSLGGLAGRLREAGLSRADVRLLDGRGRTIWPAPFQPDGDAVDAGAAPPSTSLIAHLRSAADRARFGAGGPEAAETVWSEARKHFRSPAMQMLADVEVARLRARPDASGAAAAAALDALRETWGDVHPVEPELGRALLLLRMEVARRDDGERESLVEFLERGQGDVTPLTVEERRRLHRLVYGDFGGVSADAAHSMSGRPLREPSVAFEADVSQGARLEVRLPRSVLISALDARLQVHAVPPVMFRVEADAMHDVVARLARLPRGGSLPVGLPGGPTAALNYEHEDWLRVIQRRRLRGTLLYVGVGLLFALTLVGLGLTRRAMARERAARRLRDEFIANVTHEVRTPLTSVLLHSEMLAGEDVEDDRRRAYARVVEAQGKHLARLVDDMLDFTALERGTRTLEAVPVDLGAACAEAVAPFRVLAEREDVEVVCSVPADPLEAMADPAALARVLANLLGNAWKHGRPSRDGTPSRVRLLACEGSEGQAVEVRDNGPGVPPPDRATIFQRFGRGRGASRKAGAGIGLSLSRDLARAMGGELDVRDEDGETVFRLRLPPVPELGV